MNGPVQVLVVEYEHATFSGDVLAELGRLGDAGIVQLLDLLIVSHQQDGTLDVLPPPPELPADTGRLAAAVLGRPDGGSSAASGPAETTQTWSLAEAIPVGTTAAVALIEHLWAAPLRDAVRRSGGTPLDETWLAPEDLELLESLKADNGGA